MSYNSEYSDYEHYAEIHNKRFKSLNVKGVEIFKAGEHKPMNGSTFLFSNSMLNDVVTSYDPAAHHAPVVVGHPTTDAPAYGWVSDLRLEGDTLVADFSDIDPQFAKLVKDKRYRKISASFYKPDAPSNPATNKWSLKHVGFLGATAPSIKGLKEASFSDDNKGVFTFGEDDIYGLPAEHIRTIQSYEISRKIDAFVTQGRILPMHQNQLLEFASALDNTDTLSFSDGTEHGQRDWFLQFLSELPEVVSYGELDLGEFIPENSPNAPNGFVVDPDGQALQAKANALAKAEGISFEDAVSRVSR